jgi:hypothetical protein
MSDESAELLLADPLFEVGLDAAAFGVAVFPVAIADDTALAADDPMGAIEFNCDQSISLSPHFNYFLKLIPLVYALTLSQLPPPGYVASGNVASSPTPCNPG